MTTTQDLLNILTMQEYQEYRVPILIKATKSVYADTWQEAVKKIASYSTYIVDFETIDQLEKARVFNQTKLTFNYWLENYKPLKNPLTYFRNTLNLLDHFKSKEFYHYLHSTDLLAVLPEEVIWTLINVDPCVDYEDYDKEFRIISGYYSPDTDSIAKSVVEGYFLTEKALLPDDAYQIIIGS